MGLLKETTTKSVGLIILHVWIQNFLLLCSHAREMFPREHLQVSLEWETQCYCSISSWCHWFSFQNFAPPPICPADMKSTKKTRRKKVFFSNTMTFCTSLHTAKVHLKNQCFQICTVIANVAVANVSLFNSFKSPNLWTKCTHSIGEGYAESPISPTLRLLKWAF